ncbi:MAG: hypothetical protein LBR92_00655 [Puniceicoccales bacterium]|jgi:hypothetical protein|nr:hypothetical protein [Puniceicoccales bacterium]
MGLNLVKCIYVLASGEGISRSGFLQKVIHFSYFATAAKPQEKGPIRKGSGNEVAHLGAKRRGGPFLARRFAPGCKLQGEKFS